MKFRVLVLNTIILGIIFISGIQAKKRFKSSSAFEYRNKHIRKSGNVSPFGTSEARCDGNCQSPINLDGCHQEELPRLKFSSEHWNETPEGFIISNKYDTAKIYYTGPAPTLTGGPLKGEYTLEEIHFHWGEVNEGSEHKMNGKFYVSEMHIVYYKTEYGNINNAFNFDDGLAAVGLMFEESDLHNNDELDSIIHSLPSIRTSGSSARLPGDAMTWMKKYLTSANSGGYFTYHGSLTTSPYNEVVTWINLKKVSKMGYRQIKEFRTLLGQDGRPILDNRRRLQPLNGRLVRCSN